MKIGATKKREAKKELADLTRAIGDLDSKHKQSLAMDAASALLDLRKKLQTLLNLKAQKILFSKKGFFYEHGNKTGTFLARALKDTLLSTCIAAIKTKDSQLTQDTRKISQRFHGYYTDLYNLPNTHKPKDLFGTRSEKIHKFLVDSGIPTLNDSQTLEDPITALEFKRGKYCA